MVTFANNSLRTSNEFGQIESNMINFMPMHIISLQPLVCGVCTEWIPQWRWDSLR